MLSEKIKDNAFGSLKGPAPDRSILVVVTFVERRLKEFSEKYTGSEIVNEEGLNQELCVLLNYCARKENRLFWFKSEYMEEPGRGNSAKVDIGVIGYREEGIVIGSKCYGSRESFFSLEAKRLCRISKAREREYLTGRVENRKYKECGGVERFKKGIHGRGLKYGAIIGYVQEHDFSYWFSRINSWIDELIDGSAGTGINWTEKDKLSEVYQHRTTARFESENSTKTGFIFLYHLWVNLTQG